MFGGAHACPNLHDLAVGIDQEGLRAATPAGEREPYSSTTFLLVSESSLNVRFSLVQNCWWLSVLSTLTPTMAAFCLSYFAWSAWKLWASMVQPCVISLG